MSLISRIVLAVVVAMVVGFLLAVVIGPLLLLLHTPPTSFVGGILVDWGWPIGVVAGIWWFFSGGSLGWRP